MPAGAVLHVTSMHGGGVDRYIRDITRNLARPHYVWHVADAAEVIEVVAPRRFEVFDSAKVSAAFGTLASWLARLGISVVHAHSVMPAPRARAAAAARALEAGLVVTLHDRLFLRPDSMDPAAPLDPDPAWLAQTSAFLAEAQAVIAPSDYIAGLARRHLPQSPVTVIPNGSPASRPEAQAAAHAAFVARRPARVAVVLGAIGPHKGSRVLESVAEELGGEGIAIVLIGYLDVQDTPGWRNRGLFVHGAYQDAEVAPLIRAYGAELALFPNQVAESFSYALSDLWDAGLPALVPPEGALAERVSRHGGGWLLPRGFGAAEVAGTVRRLLSAEGAEELALAKSRLKDNDAGRVPRLDAMTASLDALYDRFRLRAGVTLDPHSRPAQELLATHLDGSLFRPELARVAHEVADLRGAVERELAAANRFAVEAREWIAKLDADIAGLKADLAREVAERRRLGEENAQLAIHKAAFDQLPAVLRKLLLKKILGARS